jgi:hypothetical protein
MLAAAVFNQIKDMNDSVSNLFQTLDLSCNGSVDEKELQSFFTDKGKGFSDEHLKMIMSQLDSDGSGTVSGTAQTSVFCAPFDSFPFGDLQIDLNEFEHLVRIANKAAAHKAEFGGQAAEGGQPAAAEEQPAVTESQSAPVLADQSTPAKKIAEAKALDADLNAGEEAPSS